MLRWAPLCPAPLFFALTVAQNLDTILGPELEGTFDLVWSFGVIHHTPFPERVVAHVSRYLKPGVGEFRFMVYSTVSYKLFDMMRQAQLWSMEAEHTRRLMAFNSEAQRGSPVTYTYTYADVARLLPTAQWQLLSMGKKHIFTWDVEEVRCCS